ncbi:hypothetical protein [Nocardia sp. NPDC057353]|uniref:hypothetical protein n=1 Tax=Nocardia sp. NPDC057353 TaxID=3346104 RepID=UPI0036414FAF
MTKPDESDQGRAEPNPAAGEQVPEQRTDRPGTTASDPEATASDPEAIASGPGTPGPGTLTPDGDEPSPDITLTLGDPTPPDPTERAAALSRDLVRALAKLGPQGWRRMDAVFAMTTAAELAAVTFYDDAGRGVRTQPSPETLAATRELRAVSAELRDGPWWRLLVALRSTGEVELDHDYGDEPFPEEHLFPPEAYRADLAAYPRAALPVWLAAYLGHGGRQQRSPRDAAAQARADRAAGIAPVRSERDFPSLTELWARWAVMAAAFVAAGSPWGPRMLPALGVFEGSRRSGSSLYTLPGGRAVLSGGVWDSPELDAVYNHGAPAPNWYAGAPEWVANPVLNPRAVSGMLSFCYWWDGGSWYRGESPAADRLAAAVPGIWTAETVVDVVAGLLADEPTERQRESVRNLVSAAEIGVVTAATLTEVFGADGDFDVDSARYQLTIAGVLLTAPEPLAEAEALSLVRRHLIGEGADTARYPLERLRADRLAVGWMVYVPTAPGEVAIGRAIFYVADDGVLEQSSSSVAPSIYIVEFERRFHRRQGSVDA